MHRQLERFLLSAFDLAEDFHIFAPAKWAAKIMGNGSEGTWVLAMALTIVQAVVMFIMLVVGLLYFIF